MGAVLTSRTAKDLILASPGDFAAHFGLTGAEAASLAAMAGDLAVLMPGFVRKRERGLRQAMALTMSLLGAEATAVLEDYTEACPPAESVSADALGFAGYLIAQIGQLAGDFPFRDVIRDVARLEQMRLRAFHTEWPLRPRPDPVRLDEDCPLWLCRSAAIERFAFDVRTVRAGRPAEMLARLRPDPANLLCFQRPDDGEVVVVRLDDEGAGTARLIGRRPGEFTARDLTAAAGPGLAKLASLGVVSGNRGIEQHRRATDVA